MARSIWKGSIAFGLVHIPVDLRPAEDPHELSFAQLDKRDFARVGYERINKESGKKVEWANVVKGYEVAKGEYVVLDDATLEEANPEATHTIDISAFVDASEIHPMYFDKPYYLVPGKGGDKAYALLRATLARSGKAGIARVVIRTRQHVAALMAAEEVLVLVLLRFAHELRELPKADVPDESMKKLGITDRELSLAEKLVDGMIEPWKPEQYKDDYYEDVMKLIKAKVKAGEVNALPEHHARKRAAPPPASVDLMDLLKQSVGDHKPGPKKVTHISSARRGHPRAHAKGKARSHERKSA
jgi:DNA end-binding protein Ku